MIFKTKNLTKKNKYLISSKILLIVLLFATSIVKSQGFGKSQKLNDWYFHYGDVRLGGRETLDHSTWDKVTIPHDWSVTFPASPDLASSTGYLPGGIAWYRTDIEIPKTAKGKKIYLYFEGVYRNSEVYINGKWLGTRPNGYVSFMYEITPYVNHGGKNVIAVRVDHEEDADSRWYTGSGIYRNVKLITAEKTHFGLWGVHHTSTSINNNKAQVEIQTEITGEPNSGIYNIVHQLVDASGSTVGSTNLDVTINTTNNNTSKQVIEVESPKLWGVENPYLYQLKSTLYKGNKAIDSSFSNVGIRSIQFDADKGFALNGNWMKIKGVCLHHDAGVLGAAVPKSVWRERILKLKEIGVNGIRMSHNPQATDLYDLCDELGMLVMDEAFDEWEYPKKKWITGWNKGTPGFQGYAKYFREWGKQDLAAMVKRDRNHPSIIMWSIGNEVDYPNDPYSHPILATGSISQHFVKGYIKDQPNADRLGDIAKELAPIVRELDSSRPVTAALAGAIMSNETDYPGALDIVGYNYTEYKYDEDHATYPNRVLYGSETRHDIEAWKSVRDKDFIFGQFIWTGIDYLGEAGPWPSRGFTTGMINLANHIKPRGYFRQSLWSDEPMLYLGTYPLEGNENRLSIDATNIWNYKAGEKIRVVGYTNTDKVALFLNGKKVGKTKTYNDETGIIYWDVVYEPGALKAIGYKENEVKATTVLETSYEPESLELSTKQSILSFKNDVTIIEVRAIDKNGNLANLASNEITCTVSGDGELIGIENASNNVAENYTDNKHELLNGRAVIYIRATKNQGKIQVSVASPYLLTKNLNLTIRSK